MRRIAGVIGLLMAMIESAPARAQVVPRSSRESASASVRVEGAGPRYLLQARG